MRVLSIFLSCGFAILWKNANGFRAPLPSFSSMTRTHHVNNDRQSLAASLHSPSPLALQATAWKNPFEGLFSSSGGVATRGNKQQQEQEATRQRLIAELLQKCQAAPRYSPAKRNDIEATIQLLAPLSPIQQTATSPSLQKEWNLIWTSEKEVNFFYDWGFSDDVRQTINGTLLQNMIRFKQSKRKNDSSGNENPQQQAGFFGVNGRLSIPDVTGVRTNFEFESATLNLGPRWGEYTLPPVGAGWFDTVYLDDTWRIDTNSRNDILICSSSST